MQLLDDGLLAGVALLFGRLRFPGSWALLGFRRVGPRWVVIGAMTALAGTAVAWAISLTIDQWLPVPPHPVEAVLERASTPADIARVLIAATIPVAIGEEVFFRGFAYRLLRARLGVVLALAGSSILFALAHGLELGEWLPIVPLGVVFAVLAERSGSLIPSMIGHAAVNAVAILTGLASRP
jgi:membrane protease YdiL (CAAX protease family)